VAVVTRWHRCGRDSDAPIAQWTAHDGRRISVRPLDGASLNRFRAFVRRLSATSRARRFLAPLRELSDETARRLVPVDPRSSVAWIAEECALPGAIVAEARYAVTAPGEAELALAVADDWQRGGLGTYLLGKLLGHATAQGIECAWGRVRRDNDVALAVARRLSFDIWPDPDEPGSLMVARPLTVRAGRRDRGSLGAGLRLASAAP
jgi:acetyltransferase